MTTPVFQNISDTLRRLSADITKLADLVSQAETSYEAAEANALPPLHKRVVAALSGEYKLRSMQALIEATGATREEIIDALSDAGVEIVFRRRNHDGAELIGLYSRNP